MCSELRNTFVELKVVISGLSHRNIYKTKGITNSSLLVLEYLLPNVPINNFKSAAKNGDSGAKNNQLSTIYQGVHITHFKAVTLSRFTVGSKYGWG